MPDKRAGSVIRCPKCERKIRVPEKLSRQAPPPHLIDQALAEASEPIPPPVEKTAKPKIDRQSKPHPKPPAPPRLRETKSRAAAPPSKPKPPPRQEPKPKSKQSSKPEKKKPTDSIQQKTDSPDVVPLKRKPREEKKKEAKEKPKPTPRPKPRAKEESPPRRETQHVSPQPTPPAKQETVLAGPEPRAAQVNTQHTPYAPATERDNQTAAAGSTAGYRADRGRRQTVVYLAIWLLVITATSLVPAGLEIAERSKLDIWPGIPIWIHILILFAGIHVAYSIYLIQLPDWSTIWVVSIVTLIQAMIYAMLLGLSLLASIQSPLLSSLELTHRLRGGSISLWCVVMICLNSLFSYFGGRFGLSWRSTRVKLLRSLEPPVG